MSKRNLAIIAIIAIVAIIFGLLWYFGVFNNVHFSGHEEANKRNIVEILKEEGFTEVTENKLESNLFSDVKYFNKEKPSSNFYIIIKKDGTIYLVDLENKFENGSNVLTFESKFEGDPLVIFSTDESNDLTIVDKEKKVYDFDVDNDKITLRENLSSSSYAKLNAFRVEQLDNVGGTSLDNLYTVKDNKVYKISIHSDNQGKAVYKAEYTEVSTQAELNMEIFDYFVDETTFKTSKNFYSLKTITKTNEDGTTLEETSFEPVLPETLSKYTSDIVFANSSNDSTIVILKDGTIFKK